MLEKSRFGIWIGCHESQGFALQEALSMNVPLLVMNVSDMREECVKGRFIYEHHKEPMKATAIPYWSNECGEVLLKDEESKILETLELMNQKIIERKYSPREFIEKNLDWKAFQRNMETLLEKENK